jgi:hypothetical protein
MRWNSVPAATRQRGAARRAWTAVSYTAVGDRGWVGRAILETPVFLWRSWKRLHRSALLIVAGANLEARGKKRQTPLDVAHGLRIAETRENGP